NRKKCRGTVLRARLGPGEEVAARRLGLGGRMAPQMVFARRKQIPQRVGFRLDGLVKNPALWAAPPGGFGVNRFVGLYFARTPARGQSRGDRTHPTGAGRG